MSVSRQKTTVPLGKRDKRSKPRELKGSIAFGVRVFSIPTRVEKRLYDKIIAKAKNLGISSSMLVRILLEKSDIDSILSIETIVRTKEVQP